MIAMEVSNHSRFLLQQLNIQREFGFLCDCTVAIGNVYFKAHRAVLAAFSNYFKMIFIHQSSECIKIQPSDIQPDVFSYLLHIMYTGVGPKQPVDQCRLQEGIRFLHAHQLCRIGSEGGQDADAAKMSNLYGIQISSQSAKERLARGPGEPGSQAERPQTQPSLTLGPEAAFNRRPPRDERGSSATSREDVEASSSPLRIKLERIDGEVVAEPPTDSPSPGQESFTLGHVEDSPPRAQYCHFCGEHCGSRQGLSEHLGSHATGAPPFRVPLNAPENSHLGEAPQVGEGKEGPDERRLPRSPDRPEQLEAGSPEEAQRQCQAQTEEAPACLRGGRRRRMVCAICSLRFAQRTQLLEHRYTHTGKHGHCHRLCRQLLLQASQQLCQNPAHTQGKVSPGYTLQAQLSRESVDSVSVE